MTPVLTLDPWPPTPNLWLLIVECSSEHLGTNPILIARKLPLWEQFSPTSSFHTISTDFPLWIPIFYYGGRVEIKFPEQITLLSPPNTFVGWSVLSYMQNLFPYKRTFFLVFQEANKQTKHSTKTSLTISQLCPYKNIKTKPEHNELYYISKSRLWKQLNHIPLANTKITQSI